ncbi:PREDICTED: LOW QUALITY PROTEIN: cyclic AMP-responsive element-binding protein 3-like, partial [Phaethon lepturus]|uniref:LOW QUALITY PROTEIN: cyclic AMP-responsive element-binding protein 3-like n=1 Tax=Phaethon lepturus TaxID=97097 RepID=UPI000530AC49
MLWPEELPALSDEDLLDFLLKDDVPCPEIPQDENGLLEDWSLPEAELLDKEVDDFISSILRPFEGKSDMPQGYLPAGSDSSVSEVQHQAYSPGTNFASSLWSSDVVQVDHNYSVHQNCPALRSVRSDIEEGDIAIDLVTRTGLEGRSKELEQRCSLPIAVDAGPHLVPGANTQSDLPELFLTEEEMQFLEKEGFPLSTSVLLTENEDRVLKKVDRKFRRKVLAQDNHHGNKIYMGGLENRVAARPAQNNDLEKEVQLLQKENMSLLKQLQALQSLSTNKTVRAKTFIVAIILSFCLIFSSSICSFVSREPQWGLRVLSRQIRELPNQ